MSDTAKQLFPDGLVFEDNGETVKAYREGALFASWQIVLRNDERGINARNLKAVVDAVNEAVGVQR